MPEYTADCDGVGVLRMLDAIRATGMEKKVKFYQASTSELYGKVQEVPQSETTPFYPRSPYAGMFYFQNPQFRPKFLLQKNFLTLFIFYLYSGEAVCFLDLGELS